MEDNTQWPSDWDPYDTIMWCVEQIQTQSTIQNSIQQNNLSQNQLLHHLTIQNAKLTHALAELTRQHATVMLTLSELKQRL